MIEPDERRIHAVLRRLAIRGASLRTAGEGEFRFVTANAENTGPRVEAGLVASLVSRGLLMEAGDGVLAISPAGKAAIRRRIAAGAREEFAAQHRTLVSAAIEHESGPQTVAVNAAESPACLAPPAERSRWQTVSRRCAVSGGRASAGRFRAGAADAADNRELGCRRRKGQKVR
jgi:hypothetical protein